MVELIVFNVFNFSLKIIDAMSSLFNTLYDFLFYEIEIASWTFDLWALLSGTGLIALLIAKLIKKLVPLV